MFMFTLVIRESTRSGDRIIEKEFTEYYPATRFFWKCERSKNMQVISMNFDPRR